MATFLQRLFGTRGARAVLACYLRENGPIAYELDLFGTAPRDRADVMMASGLSWAWWSGTREWTHLTRISLSAFLADIPQGAVLIAAEGDLPTEITNEGVAEWIRRFCRVQPGPLVAAITLSDPRQLLFVQQHATETVNGLLDAWGLDKRAAERRAYPRLGSDRLEAVEEKLRERR